MCGIVGYVGKNKCLDKLIYSLKSLEYRGYDSVGIAYFLDNKINIIKNVGRVYELEKEINIDTNTNIGIGHTRWATHGKVTKINAHPHRYGKITLVHNGIIENYMNLKEELLNNNYKLISDTDTEVACAYLNHLYDKHHDINICLDKIKNIFIGSYAFIILCDDNPDKLYITKKGSPLILGVNPDEKIIASDLSAIIKYTNKYIILDDNDIGIIDKDNFKFYNDNKLITKDILTFDKEINEINKNGYDHFMLKEINEQYDLIKNTINNFINNKDEIIDISKYNNIYIVGCGSAYNAGLVGKEYIENILNIKVSVEIASEFRYKKLFINENDLVIAISQSGETADTIEAIKIAKEKKAKILGIVNTYKSTIANISDEVIYINAGIEVAVATTKAYMLQVLNLILLCYKDKKLDINNINKLYNDIKNTLNNNYELLAKKLSNKEHIFFIGRKLDYYLAIEGTLKLKEISYIHASCYAAGELKHGTISLIDENTPVIAVITDKSIASKTISNIKEISSRGAYVILIHTDNIKIDDDICNEEIKLPYNEDFNYILTAINLQLLAYYVAKDKGCDIDKPRNLAKSVTVE